MTGPLSRLARSIAFTAVVAAAATSLATPAGAVANGGPVPEGRYRFAVQLTMTGIPKPGGTGYGSACSAALLSPWWIITAGHCFHDPRRNPVSGAVPYETTATIGRADLSHRTGHVAKVVSVRQAPSGDIALAKLDRPVHDVVPLRVAEKAPRTGAVLRITGWGKLAAADPAPSRQLRTGQVRVSSVAPVTVGVKGYRPALDTSACEYDSGAPYFAEPGRSPVLVSVESTGASCPHDQEETTTRVDPLHDWIRETLLT
ncbi:trypsin-like serine protease [Dactylosporangium sp. NPDC049140]|uniref:S1 family peptidase n=1 Tax=Dactylosporangium sp. NPDC049140 TaxID=3155647 RepID=UPI003410E12F